MLETSMLTRNASLRFVLFPLALVLFVALCLATSESTGTASREYSDAASYKITPEAFQKLLKAEGSLTGLMERDNTLEKSIALNGDHDTFEAWLRRIESNTKAVSVIKDAGLTPREYLKTLVAVFQAYAVDGVSKLGKPVPPHLQAQVPLEHVAF